MGVIIQVDILAKNEDGYIVINGFVITPTIPTALGDLEVGGKLSGAWLIVPGNLGITDTNGAVYELSALITYTLGGVTSTVRTIPKAVTVYPQPYVELRFSHSQPQENGDFYVEVVAENNGYGIARNLVLGVNSLTTMADLDGNGRSLIFSLKETILDGVSNTYPMDYAFRFGDLQPGDSSTGRWVIGVSPSDGSILEDHLVTGFRVSCEHLPYLGLELSPLLNCGDFEQPKLADDCPACSDETNAKIGQPINTGNGNYDYRQSTPQISTVGNPLRFTWTYNSLNTGIDPSLPVIPSTLGNGWTHNYQMRLDFSQLASPRKMLVVRAPHGTPLYFQAVQDRFEPIVGVHATLDYGPVAGSGLVYTVTTGSQMTYVFNDAGRLVQQIDAHGNGFNFTYNGAGELSRVEEPVSGRFLDFIYNADGTLSTVTDPINRATQFIYNPPGRLTQVIDTREKVWQYDYTEAAPGFYLLSRVTDPDDRILEETGFDELGRAITQTFRGQDLSIAYFKDGRRIVTDGLGQETIYVYNQQGLLVGVADADRELEKFAFDGYTNRSYVEDRNGNATYHEKTQFGYTTAITDVMGYDLSLAYDDNNNWTKRVDQRGEVTLFDYDGNNLITETNHFSDTITYTYNGFGQMTSRTDENDVTTYYGFDAIGQMTVITDALEHTTHFAYDSIGRVITTTDVGGRITINQYDRGDNLVQVINNAHPTVTTQNYLDTYNLITQYGYDGMGNQHTITDTVGRVNRTFFDEYGRVITQVTNYTSTLPLCDFNNPHAEYNICSLTEYDGAGRVVATTDNVGRVDRTFYNDLGQVVGTVRNASGVIVTVDDLPACLSLPEDRDEDICSLFAHDVMGNSIIMTDTVGRMTRTFYDPLHRIEGMIMNWDGSATLDDCASLPAARDQNICMQFGYDEKGNTTVMTDTLGHLSRTFYDEMGRTKATVANWNPATLTSPDDCVFSQDNSRDENICTLTEYDAAGNQTVVTNPLGQRTLTVYDGMNRPFIAVSNWDGMPILSEADCIPPTQPDTNVCTVTYYDEHNRPYATKDPLGNLSDIGYDSLGRVVTTTRYLEGVPVSTVVAYDVLGRRQSQTDAQDNAVSFQYDALNRPQVTISAEGVVITQTYDAAGRVVSSTNNLGHTTSYRYDDLDRLVKVIDAEENETTYVYNVRGNQVGVIDANNVRTTYEYDASDRLVQVIENDTNGAQTDDSNVVTEYGYDAAGNQLWIQNARGVTVTEMFYDELYRPRVITDALQHSSTMQYNALGMQTVITDSNGAVTRYAYDGLNRPVTITYASDNATVNYTYNAIGSKLSMQDGVGLTTYEYDDLYRPITVTHPITGQVVYGYDLLGNRTSLQYPDGRVVTYTYNADNQMTQLKDWSDTFTDYEYDGVGRLITTTLPNGVYSVNRFDDTGRLRQLSHYAADDALLADYEYELDGVGNRQMVTETLYAPGVVNTIEAFLEENGLLVLEAESGTADAGSGGYEWLDRTAKTGFAGDGYLQALPDKGGLFEADNLSDSPMRSYRIQTGTPATYTVWVRGMATDVAGDSLHVGLNGTPAATADKLTGFGPNAWGWSRLTMDNVNASLDLSVTGTYTLNMWMREDGLRVDRLLLVTDTTYMPTGEGPAASPVQVLTDTVAPGITSHVIAYEYDPLYRLTDAVYTGDIAATYRYAYDPVGNMNAYTETVGTETTHVSRTFDPANRLETALDAEAGTTSYLYDNNGNLTLIIPPGGAEWLHYGFDQRNLMISHTVSVTGTNLQLQAEFAYDGAGSRVRQVDYTGASPATTTYVNDIIGLTQVLVADDGTEQVHNLFGLDLIGQDEGASTRYLLADGLGSVRTELVDGTVESVTTYDPYGNLLQQTGDSGTTYGYTGEQQDSSTGLLYLRARYYNPALRSFMGRDAWSGDMRSPKSMNGWSYVNNNPIGLIDVTGRTPTLPTSLPSPGFPYYCQSAKTKAAYALCVIRAFKLDDDPDDWKLIAHHFTGTSFNKEFDSEMNKIQGEPGCYWGPVPYRAKGYAEGGGSNYNLNLKWVSTGTEIVYDFAKLQRAKFYYSGYYVTDSVYGVSLSESVMNIKGFKSWHSIVDDYGGKSIASSFGIGANVIGDIGLSIGLASFRSKSDYTVNGTGLYFGDFSFSIDAAPVVEGGYSGIVDYYLQGEVESYVTATTIKVELLFNHIIKGDSSPWLSNAFYHGVQIGDSRFGRNYAVQEALWHVWLYQSMLLAWGGD